MKGFVKWLVTVLPLIYMVAIWVMSSLPDTAVMALPDRGLDRFIKESLHLVEFALLYVLFVGALWVQGKFTARTNIIFALLAGFYGLTDEIHQSFIPARSATVIDFVKDITGVAVCFWIITRSSFYKRSVK
ncbi:VanZ family protein [Bacillus sp. 2205SS5-2]|uniref:VanZ family protein n=1 Tax=Bacillus sp. 2205SS5-2 TaxID=3109031 RepID=UPI0030069F65